MACACLALIYKLFSGRLCFSQYTLHGAWNLCISSCYCACCEYFVIYLFVCLFGCCRRMFPGIAISVSGLELDSKYTLTLEMKPTDNSRFKYLNSKWVVVGKAEAHNEDLLKHVHTDSPASGRHWMANKVSFKKVKLTNNKADKNKRNLVCLHFPTHSLFFLFFL